MSQSPALQTENQYYLRIKADLLKQYKGKFALIKNQDLVGTFDSDQDAYDAGLDKFRNVPFLMVRIQETDESAWIQVLSMGLLNASV